MSKNQEYSQALNDDKLESVSGGHSYRDVIHVVQQGETLSSIADRYKTTTAALLQLNPKIKDANDIKVGQRITVRREKA